MFVMFLRFFLPCLPLSKTPLNYGNNQHMEVLLHNKIPQNGQERINVNVYVYSLIAPRVQQTPQFTPLVLELSFIQSHLHLRTLLQL